MQSIDWNIPADWSIKIVSSMIVIGVEISWFFSLYLWIRTFALYTFCIKVPHFHHCLYTNTTSTDSQTSIKNKTSRQTNQSYLSITCEFLSHFSAFFLFPVASIHFSAISSKLFLIKFILIEFQTTDHLLLLPHSFIKPYKSAHSVLFIVLVKKTRNTSTKCTAKWNETP